MPVAAKLIARDLGVTLDEAKCLAQDGKDYNVKNRFWKALCQLNQIDFSLFGPVSNSAEGQELNDEIVLEEVEVLKAIFPEEGLKMSTFEDPLNGSSVAQILVPLNSVTGNDQTMCVHYYKGHYPTKNYPKVFVTGEWDRAKPIGTAFHSELLKFISTLPNDEPMIFEIFNHAQEILQSFEDIKLSVIPLLPYLNGGNKFLSKKPMRVEAPKENGNNSHGIKRKMKSHSRAFKSRPRTKSFFWSKSPRETPPAQAFPKLRTIIENARKRLPAAKARDEFLTVMKQADAGGGVLLVTGETGEYCKSYISIFCEQNIFSIRQQF